MNKKVITVLNDKNLNEASKILKLHVSNENQMTQLAHILAQLLPQTGVLLINGIMGSGKTFLCRNFIQAKQLKCNIITMPPKVINQISSFGKSYKALTLDTV